MKIIKILGGGCAKCAKTDDLINRIVAETGISVEVPKKSQPKEVTKYNVLSTSVVVINEKVLHTGSIPKEKQIRKWLEGTHE